MTKQLLKRKIHIYYEKTGCSASLHVNCQLHQGLVCMASFKLTFQLSIFHFLFTAAPCVVKATTPTSNNLPNSSQPITNVHHALEATNNSVICEDPISTPIFIISVSGGVFCCIALVIVISLLIFTKDTSKDIKYVDINFWPFSHFYSLFFFNYIELGQQSQWKTQDEQLCEQLADPLIGESVADALRSARTIFQCDQFVLVCGKANNQVKLLAFLTIHPENRHWRTASTMRYFFITTVKERKHLHD